MQNNVPMIRQSIEKQRKCGYRKKGGMYFVSGKAMSVCCKLPFPLSVCSCCGSGIKQSRGFTWIKSNLFRVDNPTCSFDKQQSCVLQDDDIRIGLLWVGEKYYTVKEFLNESQTQGISKRISQIPRDFVVGRSWIALAHPRAIFERTPGVFQLFKPTAIEYVVTGKETTEELRALEKRGLTLVNVIPDSEQLKIQ